MTTLSAQSPAKINLTLRITGRRPDGFHELESLVARIDLCDTVTVGPADDGCYALECDGAYLPPDGSNLALQAVRALARTANINHGARIHLTKRIPAGGGLGGGSSNAATTLILLNDLWKLGLPRGKLARLAAGIGSDVPLFLHGPLSVIRGRGEQVTPIEQRLDAWAALVLPDLHCATPAVYAAWDRLATHSPRPGLDEILPALASPTELMTLLFNDLEESAFDVVPKLRELAGRVTDVGGASVRLTGSGAALFRLFDSETAAREFADKITRELGARTEVARVCTE